MSGSSETPLSVDRVRGIIDGFISKGVAYVVGLYSYLCSPETYSIISTLEPAFGRPIAEKVSSEITEAFKGISLYTKVKIGDSEVYLIDYLRKYIMNTHIKVYLRRLGSALTRCLMMRGMCSQSLPP